MSSFRMAAVSRLWLKRKDSWVANQRLVLAVVPVAALVEAAVAAEMGTAMDIGLVRKAMALRVK